MVEASCLRVHDNIAYRRVSREGIGISDHLVVGVRVCYVLCPLRSYIHLPAIFKEVDDRVAEDVPKAIHELNSFDAE